MFKTVKKLFKISFTVGKSRMIDFLLIILLLTNGVHNINTDFYAQQGDFKYVVSIQLSGAHLCTGTIIDETHILTIAHLVINDPLSELSVIAGVTEVTELFSDSISVQAIFPHAKFRKLNTSGELVEDYWENDIAILRLAEKFNWNNTYAPVQLKPGINLSSCPDCVMVSWAHPRLNSAAIIQMWNFVYTISEGECLESGIRVPQDEICFVDLLQNSLITSSKLGSPIVCDGVMLGFAVKVTDNKAPGTPSTLLNISPHLLFIQIVQTNAEIAVPQEHFQYIVSIWHGHYHSCGGSILDAIHILTAGDCVRKLKKELLKVASGYHEVSYLSPAAKWSSVRDIIYYSEDREHGPVSHEIAVLVLTEPLIHNGTGNTLEYENSGPISSEVLHQTFHWRRSINKNRKFTVKLMTTFIQKWTEERCRKKLMGLTEHQFCGGNSYYNFVADSGDIGNPIIEEGKPVGIMVKAFRLNYKSPPIAFFLKLHPYEEFIRSVTSKS